MNEYYGPTAYDSTRPRELPERVPREQLPFAPRTLRGTHRILPWGIYLRDYRNNNDARDISKLRTKDDRTLRASVSPEIARYVTVYNVKAIWTTVRALAAVVFLIIVFAALQGAFATDQGWSYFTHRGPDELLVIFIPLGITLLSSLIIPFVKDDNNIVFNRRTGMVTVPTGFSKKKSLTFRFDELDSYLRWSSNPKNGAVYWRLHLGHRTDPNGFDIGGDLHVTAAAYQLWESIQQFMDISKPLPDIPLFEPVRHLDPTTAAYDERTGRPRHFWRDHDLEDVTRESALVDKVVRKFPWEFLPHNIGPYEQYARASAWRKLYPGHAQIADELKSKGWWDSREPLNCVITMANATANVDLEDDL